VKKCTREAKNPFSTKTKHQFKYFKATLFEKQFIKATSLNASLDLKLRPAFFSGNYMASRMLLPIHVLHSQRGALYPLLVLCMVEQEQGEADKATHSLGESERDSIVIDCNIIFSLLKYF